MSFKSVSLEKLTKEIAKRDNLVLFKIEIDTSYAVKKENSELEHLKKHKQFGCCTLDGAEQLLKLSRELGK